MCLKYFIGHSTCDHHEYLGSHHCSLRPCDLDTQHFHYIKDDFPVPRVEASKAERSALACKICANQQSGQLDLDEAPVQSYAPTNDFQVKEIRPTGYTLPVNVIRVDEDGEAPESTTESDDSDDSDDVLNHDYKSLSDADEEWSTPSSGYETRDAVLAQLHRERLQQQLRDLPNYLQQQQQQQDLSFVPLGLTPNAYATGSYLHYPMPHMGYIAAPAALVLPSWHGGMATLSSVPPQPASVRPDEYSLQLLSASIPKNADKYSSPASLPLHPAKPPKTPLKYSLPQHPTPPFISGSITDAYLRMEAARKRHLRERVRRQGSSLQDALPARKMALTDFIAKKKTQRTHHREVEGRVNVALNAWSSLPFAGDGLDTDCGAEEHAVYGRATNRFSCRLVTLM